MSMLLNGPIKDSDVATLGQKNMIGERSESMPPKSVKKVSFKGDHDTEEDKEESQPEKATGKSAEFEETPVFNADKGHEVTFKEPVQEEEKQESNPKKIVRRPTVFVKENLPPSDDEEQRELSEESDNKKVQFQEDAQKSDPKKIVRKSTVFVKENLPPSDDEDEEKDRA